MNSVMVLKGFRNITEFIKYFHDEEIIFESYLNRLPPAERMVANAVLARKANKDYLLLQIRSQMARSVFKNNGYYSVSAQNDARAP